jgi:hypothetical protein
MTIFSNYYYHNSIENFITAFGALFSGIKVRRLKDDKREQEIVVPIEYGPRSKWLELVTQRPDQTTPNLKVVLPRMSFEITDYKYDAERKVGYKGFYTKGVTDDGTSKVFNPVPYTLSVRLSSLTKDESSALQIVEQILPFFSPTLNLSIEMLPQFKLKKEVPITLLSVSVSDNYDGSVNDQRQVIQTFEFNAKLDLFGPVIPRNSIIKNTQANIGDPDTRTKFRLNDQIVDPIEANSDDTYVINEEWYDLPKE